MNTAIQTLLARMDTNPEEFYLMGRTGRKWDWVFQETWTNLLNEEEQKLIEDKLREVRMKEFADRVMKTLLDDEAQEKVPAYPAMHPQPATTLTTGIPSGLITNSVINPTGAVGYSEKTRLGAVGNLGLSVETTSKVWP